MAKYNFNGVTANEGDFSVVPEGVYFVIMERAAEKRASTGTPMIKIKMRVTEGEHKGKLVFENIVLCEAMAGRNKHLLKILQQPHEGNVNINPDDWLNREFRIRVKHEPYQGKTQAKVSQFMYYEDEQKDGEKPAAAAGPGPAPHNGAAAKEKDAKPSGDEFAPDGEDEEIPF